MFRLLWVIVTTLPFLFIRRADLVIEVLALRQQLATVRSRRRPVIGLPDRLFWVFLRQVWARWSEALVVVKPETVIGWHRAGFKLFWRWRSKRARRAGRPPAGREIQDLVSRVDLRPAEAVVLHARRRVGGLHHRYEWTVAA